MMNNFTGGMPVQPTQTTQAVQYDPYQTQPQAPVQEQTQTAPAANTEAPVANTEAPAANVEAPVANVEAPVAPVVDTIVSTPAPEGENAQPISKKFCTECGKEVPAEAKFCPFCGNKLM